MEILGFFVVLFLIGLGGIALFIAGIAVILKFVQWVIEWVLGENKRS